MTLWLVRHAQPAIGPGVCYGALDVPAEPSATHACAQRLALALPRGAVVRHSPLQRCAQLAHALAGLRSDVVLVADAHLVEMHFGAWEGQPWSAIGKDALDAWTRQFAHYRCGEHGESVNDVMARVAAAWDEATAQVWITHAGVIRACSLLAQGIRQVEVASQWPVEGVALGEWVCVERLEPKELL